jgi:cupin fold WbuC family metalloprotein
MENAKTAARLALSAPPDKLTFIGDDLVRQAVEAARQSPRRRVILPLHKAHEDRLHRMFNAVQPGTYIRPHRHSAPPKAESIIVLRGAIHFFEFAETGVVLKQARLAAGTSLFGVDIEPGVIHTFVAVQPDTVIFEAKNGPYEATNDKDFAPWAPAEGTPEAAAYLQKLTALANQV